MTRSKHTFLILTALLLSSATVYFHADATDISPDVHHCGFDDEMYKNGVESGAVIKNVPKKGEKNVETFTVLTNGEWDTIRINVSKEDLLNSSRYCTKEATEKGEYRPDFLGHTAPCTKAAEITAEKMENLTTVIIPEAVKLHSQRLKVRRMESPFKVPDFTSGNSVCKHFTVPVKHKETGVSNADMVLYVAAGPGKTFGAPCATAEDGRPVAAAMNFAYFNLTNMRVHTRFVAHEIAHALGFSFYQMNKLNMTKVTKNVERKAYAVVVSSPETKKSAQDHYDCKNIDGMELEDEDTVKGTVLSHWKLRNAKDELMSTRQVASAGLYTKLTLSTFHDMGFYRAIFDMAESMMWGNKIGCSLLNGTCMTETDERNGKTSQKRKTPKFKSLFCDPVTYRSPCTTDRLGVGTCEPNPKQWWTEPEGCPVVTPYFDSVDTNTYFSGICADESDLPTMGSIKGTDSWCVDGDNLKYKYNYVDISVKLEGVCAKILCENNEVKVKYLGNDTDWIPCPQGQSIPVKSVNFTDGSQIKCPKYSEVCTIALNGSSLLPQKSETKKAEK